MRKFYIVYKDRISENLFRKFALEKSETASRILEKELYLPDKKLLQKKLQEWIDKAEEVNS